MQSSNAPLISNITVEYITNITMYENTPEFALLTASDLQSLPKTGIRANLIQNPFLCENYTYDISYLNAKLWSFNDIVLFFYNRSRFNKYLSEMSLLPTEGKRDPTIIRTNIQIMLQMLFQCTIQEIHPHTELTISQERLLTPSKWAMQFGPAPKDSVLYKIIWLNDATNNPVFFPLIQKADQYRDNLSQMQNTALTQFRSYYALLIAEKQVYPKYTPVRDSSIAIDVNQISQSIQTSYEKVKGNFIKLAQYNPLNIPEDKIIVVKEILMEMRDALQTMSMSFQKLTQHTSFNNTALTRWHKQVSTLVEDAYNASVVYVKAIPITVNDILRYNTTRGNVQSEANTKTIMPMYYDLMEEAYRLGQTFTISAEELFDIINGNLDTVPEILKYKTGISNKAGYHINIAIELRTINVCAHYDFMLGSFVERRQHIHQMTYRPPYFLSDLSS